MPVSGTNRDRADPVRGSRSRRVGWGARTNRHRLRRSAVSRQQAPTRVTRHQPPHVPVCHESPQTDEDGHREPIPPRTAAAAGTGR